MWPSLADARARVRRRLHETTAAFWTDAQLNRLINAGALDVAAKTLCIENKDAAATTKATRTVGYSGFRVNFVEYVPTSGDPIGLHRILPRQIGRVKCDGAVPHYWCGWGDTILIEPLPAAVSNLNLYVADWPAALTSDADTLDATAGLPAEVHELVVDYATIWALVKDRKYAAALYRYASYVQRIQAARSLYIDRRSDTRADIVIPDRVEIQSGQRGGG
ncbi:MAG: hypothetical protein PHV00_05950 [Syntrophales bacterium]|jgi:hypothetical protein|nr:hypothetical protein [Syntrophales bacterium]